MTKGGVYFHFAGKEELFFAVLDHWRDRRRRTLQVPAAGQGGAAAALAQFRELAPPATEGAFKGFALAFNARSEAEVDEIFDRLGKAGVRISKAPHKAEWGGYSGYFADPEGNAWEVAFNPFWPMDEAGRVTVPAPKER